MRRFGVAGLVAATLVACGGGGQTEIPPQDPELVERGADLYMARCAECHGEDLRGTDKGPSHLSEIYEPRHHPDAVFQIAVQRGVRAHHWFFGPMLAIEGLTEDDVEAIVAFVRDRQRVEGFEPYPPDD